MRTRRKLLITGAAGQLGSDLVTVLGERYGVQGTTSGTMDIRDAARVHEVISRSEADVIIHCAAMTDVDACERDPELAMAVNRDGTAHVVEACQSTGALMVYISTDYVFDGQQSEPYREADQTNPINHYGRSKLAGEKAVRELLSNSHVIVRTAWVYGIHGQNFIKTILRLARSGQTPLTVVSDQIGCPTWTVEIAQQIDRILEDEMQGIVHVTAGGTCSRYNLAVELIRIMNLPTIIEPVTSDQFPQRAPRPANSSLESARLKKAGNNIMRHWQDALRDFLGRNGDQL